MPHRQLRAQPLPPSACLPPSCLPRLAAPPARLPPPPAGTSQWPGANFILFPSGDKVFLKFGEDSEWRQIMKDK